ncbi:MAG: AAA-like domain-containing protein [Cyanobacteria bacterium J06623_5]
MILPSTIRRILILSANPVDAARLRLDQEVREIQEGLKLSAKRDQYEIISQWAVRTEDLRRALLEYEPHIVHFSGHGISDKGIVFVDDEGRAKVASGKALSRLFKLCPFVECVLLNACYSEQQSEAIAQHVDCVIGMNKAIGDRAAIAFSTGFYDALGYGRAFPEAYEFGLSAIELENIPEASTPVLLTAADSRRAAQGPARIFISYRDKAPDNLLAKQLYQYLDENQHPVFMAGESLKLGESWSQRISSELKQCSYFILLLSPTSATSEMVTEEVKRVQMLREQSQDNLPIILPVRVNFSIDDPLNYELRGYLQKIQQREWHSDADTPGLLQEIQSVISVGQQNIAEETADLSSSGYPDRIDRPPLPVAEPELYREPGGAVPLTSGLYIERPPIEQDCYQEVMQPGALIRIKAPRQMGKTSLMARILRHAKQQGCEAIPLSFQRADSHLFTDLDKLLHWFCTQIGRKLKQLKCLEDYWTGYGSKDKCNAYFEECLLESVDCPLVLGLDEVDRVFPHREVADDFFALLRSWYESARYGDFGSELWEKLRLVIVHSTEVYVPLNINQSPFNVGKNVDLPEFDTHQIRDLGQRYNLESTDELTNKLTQLIGGHPYLTRKAFYHLRRQDVTLDELMSTASTEAGIYGDHLRRHLLNLENYPALSTALYQVVTRNKPTDLDAESAYKLESMGLIRLRGNNASPRCDVYRQYFIDHLDG